MSRLFRAIEFLHDTVRQCGLTVGFQEIPPGAGASLFGGLGLPAELIEFYTISAPIHCILPWSVEDLELYSPYVLPAKQEIFRRQILQVSFKDPARWNWIEIGDFSLNPIIVDGARQGCAIFAFWHDVCMDPLMISPDLASFLELLSHYLHIRLRRFGNRILGEDCEVRAEFRDDLTKSLKQFLSDDCIRNVWQFLV
jgi:hypothetical protein